MTKLGDQIIDFATMPHTTLVWRLPLAMSAISIALVSSYLYGATLVIADYPRQCGEEFVQEWQELAADALDEEHAALTVTDWIPFLWGHVLGIPFGEESWLSWLLGWSSIKSLFLVGAIVLALGLQLGGAAFCLETLAGRTSQARIWLIPAGIGLLLVIVQIVALVWYALTVIWVCIVGVILSIAITSSGELLGTDLAWVAIGAAYVLRIYVYLYYFYIQFYLLGFILDLFDGTAVVLAVAFGLHVLYRLTYAILSVPVTTEGLLLSGLVPFFAATHVAAFASYRRGPERQSEYPGWSLEILYRGVRYVLAPLTLVLDLYSMLASSSTRVATYRRASRF